MRQLPFQNPKHQVSSASTQCGVQTKSQYFCQVERLIIDLKETPWWSLYTFTSGEGRSLVLQVWHCQTTSLQCMTGARSLGFSRSAACALGRISRPLIPDTVPCRLGRRLPFLLLSQCWQVPLNAMCSPGAVVTVNRHPHHTVCCVNTYNSFYSNYLHGGHVLRGCCHNCRI